MSSTHNIFSSQCNYFHFCFSSLRHVSASNCHHEVFCLRQSVHLFIHLHTCLIYLMCIIYIYIVTCWVFNATNNFTLSGMKRLYIVPRFYTHPLYNYYHFIIQVSLVAARLGLSSTSVIPRLSSESNPLLIYLWPLLLN
jgi:hypothetical protein